MKRYSEFISFPIYLWASKEVDVEVPVEESEEKEEKEADDTESEDEESTGNLEPSPEIDKITCLCYLLNLSARFKYEQFHNLIVSSVFCSVDVSTRMPYFSGLPLLVVVLLPT